MTSQWVPIGPSCIPNGQLAIASYAFYHPRIGKGTVSGRISAIALSPDGDTIYAGAASGGVWKSTDEGVTWTPIMDDQPTLAVGSLAVAYDGTLFVGTGEANGPPDHSGILLGVGILILEGDTWTVFPPQDVQDDPAAEHHDLVHTQIGRIVVHPTDANQLYAATSKGLFVTTDRVDWVLLSKQRDDSPVACTDVAVDFSDPARPRIYAAFDADGVYAVDGPPATFADLGQPLPLPVTPRGRIALALAFPAGQPAIIHAVLADGERLQHMTLSRNRGADWEDVPYWIYLKSADQLDFNLVFAVDPHDPERMLFGEVKLYRRTRTTFWNVVSRRSGFLGLGSYQGVHDDQHAIAFHPTRPDTIWLGNDGGMWLSTDGGERFHARNRGLHTIQLFSFSQHPHEPELLLGGTQDNGAVRYAGHPAWRIVRGGDVYDTAIHPAMPNVWLIGPSYASGRVGRSLLHGIEGSFTDRKKGLPEEAPANWAIVVADPSEPTRSFAGTDLLRWSTGATGHGGRWDVIDASDDGESGEITAIAIAPSDSSVLYYARSPFDASGRTTGTIHRLALVDGAWEHVARSGALDDDCHQIVVERDDPDAFLAVLGGWGGFGDAATIHGRLKTGELDGTDLKIHSMGALHKLAEDQRRPIGPIAVHNDWIPCNAIVRDPDHPTTIYVGTDYGVYRSTNNGTDWEVFGTGLPVAALVTSIYVHPTSRRLRVSTMGRGVWECALDEDDRSCDLYVRDTIYDHGRGTTPETHRNPGGLGDLHWHDAPDLKLDTESVVFGSYEMPSSVRYDGAALDYVGFELLDGDAPRARSTSRVYVQVHNRGPTPIGDVSVRVFLATKGGSGYPALPNDFWTTFATGDFSSGPWRALGPAQTLHQLRAAEPQVARFEHEFHGADDTIGLLAVVTSPADPVPVLSLDVEQAARRDKHVMLKQLEVKTSVLEIVIETLVIVGLLGAATYAVAR